MPIYLGENAVSGFYGQANNNAEDKKNKVTAIDEGNKESATKYPSVSAVVNYLTENLPDSSANVWIGTLEEYNTLKENDQLEDDKIYYAIGEDDVYVPSGGNGEYLPLSGGTLRGTLEINKGNWGQFSTHFGTNDTMVFKIQNSNSNESTTATTWLQTSPDSSTVDDNQALLQINKRLNGKGDIRFYDVSNGTWSGGVLFGEHNGAMGGTRDTNDQQGYTTILDYINSKPTSFSFAIHEGNPLINADDHPQKGTEYHFVVINDDGGNRRKVIAYGYAGTFGAMYVRDIWTGNWNNNWRDCNSPENMNAMRMTSYVNARDINIDTMSPQIAWINCWGQKGSGTFPIPTVDYHMMFIGHGDYNHGRCSNQVAFCWKSGGCSLYFRHRDSAGDSTPWGDWATVN